MTYSVYSTPEIFFINILIFWEDEAIGCNSYSFNAFRISCLFAVFKYRLLPRCIFFDYHLIFFFFFIDFSIPLAS
jgi:hypothetical protein